MKSHIQYVNDYWTVDTSGIPPNNFEHIDALFDELADVILDELAAEIKKEKKYDPRNRR